MSDGRCECGHLASNHMCIDYPCGCDVFRSPETEKQVPERPDLRDQLAMAAMTGLMASNWTDRSTMPKFAYEVADAMLKAREVKP